MPPATQQRPRPAQSRRRPRRWLSRLAWALALAILVVELPLALWIDFVLPKRRVLEIYLNIAEWGPSGQFGAEAGSRYAFNKSVRALSPREAALLAAVLPNPRRRSAKQPGPAVRRLALIYEARGAAQAALASCARGAK